MSRCTRKAEFSFSRQAFISVIFAALFVPFGCDGGVTVVDGTVIVSTESDQSGESALYSDPNLTTSNQEPEPQPEPEVPFQNDPARVWDITDLVLVTGQSNALGAGTAYDEYKDAPDNRVLAYTNNGWQTANLNQVWDRGWFPRNNPNTDPYNNFSIHFGKRLAQRRNDRVIGFILLSAPGQKISHWENDGQFYNEIRNKVSRAINEVPHKSRLDGILWHQGESDGQDRIEYSDALYRLIANFRSEPWFDFDLPFICGETANSPVNNQLRKLNRDSDYWTACVAAEGLPVLPGTSHFDANSLRTLGQRYADKFIDLAF